MTAAATRAMIATGLALLCCPRTAGAQQACAPRPVAQFESVRNSVQLLQGPSRTPVRAARQLPVCAGDTIQVGDDSKAVVLMLGSDTPLVIDQNSEFVVTEAAATGGSFIDLLRGALLFITRVRRSIEIRTPFVNAAIEGTEFVVRVQPDRTVITVFEGIVRATNPQGMLLVGPGQQAVAIQGQAPQLQVIVRPRDAVQWALYYERILPSDSFDALAKVPESGRDAAFYVRRAALLLSVGQVDEARADLDQAQKLDSSNGDAQAMRAITSVALNDIAGALESGRLAVQLQPRSATARLALSYALQATFELEAARDAVEGAIEAQPDNAAVWARLGELRLMLDDVGGAVEAARRAVMLAPDLPRAQSALGFALLAQLDISDARDAFERATASGPDDPIVRLGLGLAKIRQGRLAEGRGDLELALALDSGNSLIRSYLGKAYFDEKRDVLAEQQLDLAKVLDPLDPTPWLYDAIRKHALNRPVEALFDLRRSVELNNNRAVYRSRLLLDSDLAGRGARLGRVYRDLGFEQLALLEGWKSIAVDASNHSAHRLLADSYLALPRHRIARDSELLQAQLLQPINLNPVQPRLADNGWLFLDDSGVSGVGFNEFAQLFANRAFRSTADAVGGEWGTKGDNLIASGLFDRLSYSVGHFHFDSDGIRSNNDIRQNVYDVFVQGTITARTSAQVEIRRTESEVGDRRLLFFDTYAFPNQRSLSDTASVRLGGRHVLAPGSVLIGSYVHRTLDNDFDGGDASFTALEDEQADFAEIRYLQELRYLNFTTGVGTYRGDRTQSLTFGPFSVPSSTFPIHHTNAYAYGTVRARASLTFSGGLSHDDFRYGGLTRTSVNPKVGITWSADSVTTVRAAVFRAFERRLISGQTIEPTNVAGFNQFFYDGNAARSWRYGIGVDRRLHTRVYSGIEATLRRVSIPTEDLTNVFTDREFEEQLARAYVHAVPNRKLALSASYQLERVIGDAAGNNIRLLARSTTHRASGEGRVFLESGAFGTLRLTGAVQNGRFQIQPQLVAAGEDRFWVLDASFGYRLPRQRGLVVVEARNAFDVDFRFQDIEPEEPTMVPARLVTVRFTFAL